MSLSLGHVLAVSYLYIGARYTSRGGREDVKRWKEWITYLVFTIHCPFVALTQDCLHSSSQKRLHLNRFSVTILLYHDKVTL